MVEYSVAPERILFWVQTTVHRDLTRHVALDSIRDSDVGDDFVLVRDPERRKSVREIMQWWRESMLAMRELALSEGKTFIVRLEDDILVNRHLRHNVASWPALKDPRFGMGSLFVPNYFQQRPDMLIKSHPSGEYFRNIPEMEGAQGQVFRTDLIASQLDRIGMAYIEKGYPLEAEVDFDVGITCATWLCGRRTFLHFPGLVDVSSVSKRSTLRDIEQEVSGSVAYNPDWKRE